MTLKTKIRTIFYEKSFIALQTVFMNFAFYLILAKIFAIFALSK